MATNHTLGASNKASLKQQHNEVWGYYPDDKPLHTLALKGDSRAALAPFLAFRWALGSPSPAIQAVIQKDINTTVCSVEIEPVTDLKP